MKRESLNHLQRFFCAAFHRTKLISILVIIAGISLSGCTTRYFSDVQVFHELPANFKEGTFSLVPASKENEGSLEFKTLTKPLVEAIKQYGLEEVPFDHNPDYIVVVHYQIDSGTTYTESGSVPIYGQTGGGYTTHSGNIYSSGSMSSSYYQGSSNTSPTYGITGLIPYSHSYSVYTRQLFLDILNGDKFRMGQTEKVYETKVVSKGSSDKLSQVVPYMIESVLQDFPGKNSSTRTVVIRQHHK